MSRSIFSPKKLLSDRVSRTFTCLKRLARPVSVKAEKLKKEREEGKPEKKKRRNVRRKPMGPTNSAGEAIEKILQEKKISSKINYDVLKSLNASINKTDTAQEEEAATSPSLPTKR